MSVVNQLWDAIYTDLQGDWLEADAVLQREFVALAELKDGLETLTISVEAPAELLERVSRGGYVRRPEIHIAVQRKVETEDQKKDLLDLCDRIATRYFESPPNEVSSLATCVGCEKAPLCSHEHLEQYGAFGSVIVLRYRERN